MGGTIRCKHGFRLVDAGIIGQGAYEDQVVVLQCADAVPSFMSGTDEEIAAVADAHKNKAQCQTTIPRSLYDNITKNDCNFTHVIFNSQEELDEYRKSRSAMFRWVSSARHEMEDGRIRLVH